MHLTLEQRAARCRAELDHATGDIASRERCILRHLRAALADLEARHAPLLDACRGVMEANVRFMECEELYPAEVIDLIDAALRPALEALGPPPEDVVAVYTDSPPDYDGFGTRTLETIGRTRKGDLRKVAVRKDALQWQRDRYASGLYLAALEAEMQHFVSTGYVRLDADDQPH